MGEADEHPDVVTEVAEDPIPAVLPETPREPLALETALVWLAKIKPTAVLALLRVPEFALVNMTAFAGFRVNATSYDNPLVRRRLAQEAIRDEAFADKLLALAEEAPPIALPSAPHAPESTPQSAPDTQARQENLRAERDRRRRERDEARQALAAAESSRTDAERLQHRAESERDEAHHQSHRQAQRIARLERQVAKLQVEQASLLHALKGLSSESIGAQESVPPVSTDAPSEATDRHEKSDPWQEAVAHLLHKRRYDMAISLAEDVLRAEPSHVGAIDIAVRAYIGLGDARGAVPLLRRRLTAALDQNQIGEGGETLLRLLLLIPPTEAEREVRAFLHALRPENRREIEQTQGVLARLQGLAPDRHEALAAQISRLAPAALAQALMPPPGLLGPDDPLPLGTTPAVSARQLLQAIDVGNTPLVAQARKALRHLCETAPETQDRIRQALERAGDGDDSYLVPLMTSRERGPAIVDGSNAAWFDQESLAAGRPRLRPLRELRRALRARGYFPIYLYADAPLPYTVDEPAALRAMVARGELTLVDSGVDADEVLLREAKRLSAPLVTNDYMADWDPLGQVPKIRYTLSLHGEAYLLSDA